MRKKCRKTWNELLPKIFFFLISLSHNTANCIVTDKTGRQRAGARHDTAQQATTQPLLGHDTARRPAIRPCACVTRRVRHTARSARVWEQGRDTKICIVAEGTTLGCDTTALRCDTAQHRAMIRRREARGTACNESEAGARLQHCRPQATIRLGTCPQHGCDTAGLGTVCAAYAFKLGQGVHTVHPTQFD